MAAWAELQRKVGAWAATRGAGLHREIIPEVVDETCAEVWRMLQLARGGVAFEGFVQGRYVGVVRRLTAPTPVAEEAPPQPAVPAPVPVPAAPVAHAAVESPAPPLREAPRARPRDPISRLVEAWGTRPDVVMATPDVMGTPDDGANATEDVLDAGAAADEDEEPSEAEVQATLLERRMARLQKTLGDLRRRNPLHHRAVTLVYLDAASVAEAADALAVDVWTVRTLLARAREALADGVDRSERAREARLSTKKASGPTRRAGGKPRRSGFGGSRGTGGGGGGPQGGGKPSGGPRGGGPPGGSGGGKPGTGGGGPQSGGRPGGSGGAPGQGGGKPGRPGARKGRPPGGGRPR